MLAPVKLNKHNEMFIYHKVTAAFPVSVDNCQRILF
jgi:hypothetical protein